MKVPAPFSGVNAPLPGQVYRRIPEALDQLPDNYKHSSWTIRQGVVELPSIEIPLFSVIEGMARLEGAEEFEVGTGHGLAPAHGRRVPAFYLDVTELKVRDFVGDMPERLPEPLRADPPPDDHPITRVTWHEAVAAAERLGKRLPDEAEYEYAATKGGTRRYPWGDAPPGPDEEWTFGPAGEPAFDRLDTDPPVFGLFSNVAEWTASRVFSYPAMSDMPRLS